MKVTKKEKEQLDKILKKINFDWDENSFIFFPIKTDKIVEENGFQFEVKNKNDGLTSYIKPGYIISKNKKSDNLKISLAYGTIEYAPNFDLIEFIDLLELNVTEKEKRVLKEFDCLLLKKDYILSVFD